MKEMNIPVGVSDFEEIRKNGYYYIDKSGLIGELLSRTGTKVTLITRPRRFGKTLGMSMLESFFDIRKDSLYCDRPDADRRRAARTVMDEVFMRLTAWLAPLTPFTMEEAWTTRFPEGGTNCARVIPETPGQWRNPAEAERWAGVNTVLTALGMYLLGIQPVGLLSGGQRQALALLMATLVTPKLLLLDEHTAALDPATAEKVLELTRSIVAEKKITCLMVTHNMHQALELGNRTLMMDAGRIVFDVKGAARSKMTVDDLLEKFRENAGKNLDNDRILLSKVEK